ncbi:zinc ABC transporter ATP-binding protein AztA [Pectobacterium sp. CHL-2024]|uniref:zinc ABC transporter ATP-binding protein AztA n=1 Tax=Pectobacterium sp. CHL-2024 TaxID=3377079 RepID=UPI00381253FB
MTDFAVQIEELALGYDGNPALSAVSGSVHTGSLTAVVGPNGSGKSTLLKGIAGILQPLSGFCRIASGARIAYLPQLSELDRSFPASVRDLVSLGLWQDRGLLRWHRREDRVRISQALAAVGLAGFDNKPLSALSGGQFQRALFARVIVQNASIILLDEPFNAIDTATTQEMLALIKSWHAQQRTVIVVIHDPELVLRHFPDTLMVNGTVVAWGKTEGVMKHSPNSAVFCQHNTARYAAGGR